MKILEERMPKRPKKEKAFWERGYLSHGYWRGNERLGTVKLGPKEDWDGLYRWQAGDRSGEASTLEEAKRAVEEVVLLGSSQPGLFDKN
jgi:hypothetical protein